MNQTHILKPGEKYNEQMRKRTEKFKHNRPPNNQIPQTNPRLPPRDYTKVGQTQPMDQTPCSHRRYAVDTKGQKPPAHKYR